MDEKGTSESSWGWLWPMLPPLAPVLGAAVILQFLDAPGLSPDAFAEPFIVGAESKQLFARHLGSRMTYSAVVFFHAVVCFFAIFYFRDRLREAPKLQRRTAYTAIFVEAGLVLAALVGLSYTDLAGHKLTYFNIRALLGKAPVGNDLVEAAHLWGISKLSVAVLFPTAFGVVSAVMAACVASLAASVLPDLPETEWLHAFRDRVNTLQESFLLLSAVLVTSTLTASLFFHLPTQVFEFENDSTLREALVSYARGLSVFWGAIYTLTLIAVFAPPGLILRHRVKRFALDQHGVERASEFQEWLSRQGLTLSVKNHLANLAAVMAPLVTGPIGSLIQTLGG